MKTLSMPFLFLAAIIFISACSPEGKKLSESPNPEVVTEIPAPTPLPEEPAPPTPVPGMDPSLGICSKLDIKDVLWPSDLTFSEWTHYALALNITGSYEGRQGWINISGNFDGQGMSLGLMQQNLGQGTLQPWLIQMYKQHNSTMTSLFSPQDYANLKSMLESWQKSAIASQSIERMYFGSLSEEELFPVKGPANRLEIDYEERIEEQGSAENAKSVSWAQQNILDTKGDVTSRWKKSFQDMAGSSNYRSFQLAASTSIFKRAKQYFLFFNFTELRFLLFLFDIVVQNGSIGDAHLAKYNSWLKQNPNATEQARALALLEARLTTVKPQYVEDVRSRKSTIIYGTGTVHQTRRNLPEEYCFDPRVIVQ